MHDAVLLIPVEEGIERGNIVRNAKRDQARKVFAQVGSVGEKEFYDSAQAGYELSIKAQVWIWDYAGELMLIYAGEEYRVVRTYRNDKLRRMELYCEKAKGRG